MNGRSISTLSTNAQSASTSLGFTIFLPDGSDRFLKAKNISETLGTSGGISNIAITQGNLPNVTYNNIQTVSNGDHTHDYNDRASGITTSAEIGSTRTVVDNTFGTFSTSSSGNHSHTYSISTGGSGTAMNITPKYLSTYIYVYLGQ